ncbi:MAG: HemK/PrmC family methyltransferase [Patescibacteria group bacterium]
MKNQEKAWLLKEKYQGTESEAFHADCARLEAGVPLAFIIGSIPFLDCTIYLDSNPLIPRPETEYWVEKAITAIRVHSSRRDLESTTEGGLASSLHILDLCAGSGAIGVAVAKTVPSARVTFAELDPDHLPTIKKNLTQNTIIYDSEKYPLIVSDLFQNISPVEKFNFILTNPPYIDLLANTVDANVVEHEPHLALFGGVSGMELISKIISQAPHHLDPLGQLWIEHEPAQVEAIAVQAIANGFTIITHPDQYGVPRFSVLTMAQ